MTRCFAHGIITVPCHRINPSHRLRCNTNRDTKQHTSVWAMPDCVILQLKRFETTYVNGPRGFEAMARAPAP